MLPMVMPQCGQCLCACRGLVVGFTIASPWLSPAWAKTLKVVNSAKIESRIVFMGFSVFTKVNLRNSTFVVDSAT